jgi:tetratricopeptide (TPR) repeat protein
MADGLGSAKRLIKAGDSSFHTGDYHGAVSSYSRAMKLLAAAKVSESSLLALADAQNGMGHALRSKGQYSRALAFNERAVALYLKLSKGKRSVAKQLVKALHYTADSLADLNRIDQALAISREELKIARKLYSKDRKNLFYLTYGLNGTAARLSNKKRFKEAARLLNQSLRAQQNAVGSKVKKYPNLSWTYHLLGATYLNSGDEEGAIRNLQKALQMRLVIAEKNKRYTGALRNTLEALSLAYGGKNSTSARSQRGYL